VEFILSIAEGLLAMTGEKTFYEFIKIASRFYQQSRLRHLVPGQGISVKGGNAQALLVAS